MAWGKFAAAALAAAMMLVTSQVEACEIGGREVACPTKNGHYRIRTPEGTGPHPTVVYLYGSTGNSGQILSNDSFVQAFIDRGYAVIVPAALDIRYRDGEDSGWHLRHERVRGKRDEIAFIAEVLADAEVRHRINRRRVLITGMSRGGFLTWEIACHAPTLANAYAPVAAGYLGRMPRKCERPVRLLHTHGRADQIVPLEQSERWRSGGATMRPLGEALDTMANTGGCINRGEAKKFKDYDRTTWQGCPRGASVDLLLHNGGHTIPLSWYSTVVDWFESDRRTVPQGVQGGTARFQGASAGEGSSLLRPGTARDNSRFKKAKVPTN